MESPGESSQWLTRTAADGTTASAPAVPLPGRTARLPGPDR
ncbi:hypothetical protein ACFRMN_09355 [Streptomyces sp. NPDC056835]